MKIILIIILLSLAIPIPLPGYPEKSDITSKTDINGREDISTSRPSSSRAKGTSLLEIAKLYYGVKNTSISNEFLDYPEPNSGWENEEFCQNSVKPSPINIPYETDLNIIKNGNNVEILSLDYNFLDSGKIEYQLNHAWGLGILDGGSIRVRIEKKESIFYLSEVYFHLYSEHRLESKQYPLEIQLVHYSDNYQNNNEKLIISVLFDYSNNIENEFLKDLKIGLSTEIEHVDFSDVMKKSTSFYYYKGGLTIPPCSENVNWIIFRDIYNMSYSQFETIKNFIESTNYYKTGYGNARGIKPLNSRKIYYETNSKISNKISSNVKTVENQNSNGKIPNYKFIYLVNILMFISLLF